MRKLSYLLGLFITAGLIFSSCSKDEEEDTPPSLKFLGGNYTYENGTTIPRTDGDVTMETGKPLVFGFTTSSTTDKNLKSIKITRNYENVSLNVVWDTTLSTNFWEMDIVTVSYPLPGSEVFEITVTDRNEMTATISFTVTTTQADPGINVYNNISLGSYTSSTNSSFASVTGETFSMVQAEDPAVQAKISWIYFHGVTYGHTLMSPANATIEQVFEGVADWDNRNTTLMGKTNLTKEAYELVVNKNQLILSIQNSGVDMTEDFVSELQSNPGGFEVDDIIAFETGDGHQGLLRIMEVNEGASLGESTIKYNVKVEK